MSETPDILPPFETYPCSLGTVIGHAEGSYIISTTDGRVIGIPAATTPSPENVEADIAAPVVPPPAPPRELSKLTLRRRIRALGKETLFDATLDAVPNARADWDDAQVLRTDDPLFTTHAAAFKAALGLTEEEFTALLAP